MTFPRLQLFEFEDLAWFPSLVRDYATDYLQFVQCRLHLHKPVLPLLRDALARSGSRSIVDLCSGGSGPILALKEELQAEGRPVDVTLTDLFPSQEAMARARSVSDGRVRYHLNPVDARSVPPALEGFRTVFNAFHHFAPEDARSVLRDSMNARQPIGIFEIPDRSVRAVATILWVPLLVLALTPLIRPFRWRRLFFTYLLPLVPLTCWWDGIVSQLRAYTTEELHRLVENSERADYRWDIGRVPVPGFPLFVTYLIGVPGVGADFRAEEV